MDTSGPSPLRSLPRTLSVAAAAAALTGASALPATAAPNDVVYDALGDSYAAGSGVAPSQAYPNVLDGRMKIALDDFAAVPGATVQTMLAGQLGALDAETDLVTISIGGNDIGWTDAITACLIFPDPVEGQDPTVPSCANAVAASGALMTQPQYLPSWLDAAYTQVSAAAPDAHVVVTGYPRLFSPENGPYTLPLSPTLVLEASVAEQHIMNAAADQLNATIRTAAETHGFQFVDVTQRFVGHGVNSPETYLFGLTDPVPFHPNVDGQHAYGVALRSQLNPNDLR